MTRYCSLFFFLIFLGIGKSHAQLAQPGNEIDALSLHELMNIKLTVASAKELTPRESPGVVSYITSEDIRKTGARNLMEVLEFVPGFEFGTDVEGVVGLGIRGNWAHEGKVVLLLDGIEMNETLYSTLQFGNHYPVENIDRIEIIRGPGSALYGGFAAYAVINVISRKARNPSETSVSVQSGIAGKGMSYAGFSASQGFRKEKLAAGMNIQYSQAERSQDTYTDVYGTSFSMHDNSDLDNIYVNGYINIGKTQLQLIADQYNTSSRDQYVEALDRKYDVNFGSYNASLCHDFKAGDSWKIVPKVTYSMQQPWSNPEGTNGGGSDPFHITTSRLTAQVNATGTIASRINLLTGIQYFNDHSIDRIEGKTFVRTGTSEFNYNNAAIYAQGLYSINNWNIIAGFRGNYNSHFDPMFTPRVGVTFVRNSWHFKALYNKSFRSPGTQNLNLAETIYPEQTGVAELEAGISLAKSLYLTTNFYHINTVDPIVYYYDAANESDAYINMSKTGSYGFETTLQYKTRKCMAEANFSFYQPGNSEQLDIYSASEGNQYLGFSPVKLNLRYRYNFSKAFSGSITAMYKGSKYGITGIDTIEETQIFSNLPATIVCNLYLDYTFQKMKGLGIGIGVNNILDEDIWYVQPYTSNHAPLPGMGRELTLKVFYRNI